MCRIRPMEDDMPDGAGEPAAVEPAVDEVPEEPADPDWFHQIPFNPRKGLNSVIPVDLPDRQTRRLAEEGA
jgi:hypothetical protein